MPTLKSLKYLSVYCMTIGKFLKTIFMGITVLITFWNSTAL